MLRKHWMNSRGCIMTEQRICHHCDEWMVLRCDLAGTSSEDEKLMKFWECPGCGGEEDYA